MATVLEDTGLCNLDCDESEGYWVGAQGMVGGWMGGGGVLMMHVVYKKG